MKLTEHLERIIRLLDDNATLSTIKGEVLALHQEVEGHQATIDQNVKLVEENTKLKETIEKMKSKTPPTIRVHTGMEGFENIN